VSGALQFRLGLAGGVVGLLIGGLIVFSSAGGAPPRPGPITAPRSSPPSA